MSTTIQTELGYLIPSKEKPIYIASQGGAEAQLNIAAKIVPHTVIISDAREKIPVPTDNPFSDQGGVTAQIWSLGHRNPLGIAFDQHGRLWNVEMGPRGGDELNLVVRGANYGYPIVSNGDHYSGQDIPDHETRPEFAAPKVWWTPVISPGDLMFYSGNLFPEWKGSAFVAGLSAAALLRIEIKGDAASEANRFDMNERIRAVRQGPNGAIWLLEDGRGGRLLKLTPN